MRKKLRPRVLSGSKIITDHTTICDLCQSIILHIKEDDRVKKINPGAINRRKGTEQYVRYTTAIYGIDFKVYGVKCVQNLTIIANTSDVEYIVALVAQVVEIRLREEEDTEPIARKSAPNTPKRKKEHVFNHSKMQALDPRVKAHTGVDIPFDQIPRSGKSLTFGELLLQAQKQESKK